jgi:hypothetical protein
MLQVLGRALKCYQISFLPPDGNFYDEQEAHQCYLLFAIFLLDGEDEELN